MLQHILRLLGYFLILSIANHIYPGSSLILQGFLLIILWGTWFHNNDNWQFAQKYGKYFNWFGAAALLNGAYHIATTYL